VVRLHGGVRVLHRAMPPVGMISSSTRGCTGARCRWRPEVPEALVSAGRSFTGPADFNAQLQQWLALVNAAAARAGAAHRFRF
jgi:hypothetical protein